jgi:methyltransferase (TIGR00027 family)
MTALVAGLGPPSLSDVENTGLLTALCHAAESRSPSPLLRDPHAEVIADRLRPVLAASSAPLHRRLARGRLRQALVVHLAMRARKFDAYARDFASRHPGCCVVNLGCGLDTRFWRIDDGRLRFRDLDLPEMIAFKRRLVDETARYRLIGMSVLDVRWVDELAAEGPGPFIFLAEGLFMYLPPEGVRGLVVDLGERFPGSELVFEAVNATWLRPSLKWMIDVKMRKELGLGRGTAYRFGIRDGHEVEAWSPGIRLLDEWSYLDEDEPRVGALRRFRGWDLLRRTQWTLRYALGPGT